MYPNAVRKKMLPEGYTHSQALPNCPDPALTSIVGAQSSVEVAIQLRRAGGVYGPTISAVSIGQVLSVFERCSGKCSEY